MVASRPTAPPSPQRKSDSPRKLIRISNCEKPSARMVPISRVRALTAANMVLAEENMAPKVRSTAINVPAPFKKMPERLWVSK